MSGLHEPLRSSTKRAADLLGQELVELLTTIGCVRGQHLLRSILTKPACNAGDGGSKAPNAGETCQSAALVRIELGIWRQQRWQLALDLLPASRRVQLSLLYEAW
jgi:hypothetical protein